MEPQPWWLGFLAPVGIWLINWFFRVTAIYFQSKAEELEASGHPIRARKWMRLAALFTNYNIGRKLSVAPPPMGAIPTLPAPDRVPKEAIQFYNSLVDNSRDLAETLPDSPRSLPPVAMPPRPAIPTPVTVRPPNKRKLPPSA